MASSVWTTTEKMSTIHVSLLKRLNEFRKTGEFCDIRLKVGNRYFDCHKVILASATNFFHMLFKSAYRECNQKVVELRDVDENIFEILLNFMYFGELDVLEKDVVSVLAACVYFQLKEGEDTCINVIKYNLHAVNVFELFSLPCLKCRHDVYDSVKTKNTSVNVSPYWPAPKNSTFYPSNNSKKYY